MTVPDIGGDEVEVTEVMVSAGDTVDEEQSILNVEGDKASMEVPAPFAGKVKEVKVAVGDTVKTGSLIFVFEGQGSACAAAQQLLRLSNKQQRQNAQLQASCKATCSQKVKTSLKMLIMPMLHR